MMSIGKVRSASALLYYDRGDAGEAPSVVQWIGRGAKALGLENGQSWREAQVVLEGEMGAREFRGWDMTFSVPKSVSVMWAAAGKEARAAIESAVWGAVRYSVRFLEENTHLARCGHAGVEWVKAGMVVGGVMHTANRRGEPHLHVHAIAANAAYLDSGSFGALHSRSIYQAKMVSGALFRCELARELQALLGVELRAGASDTFEVAGVSDDVIRRFSTRAADVQHAVSGKPWAESARGREIAALSTREKKLELSQEALDAKWAEEIQALGRAAPERLRELSGGKAMEPELRMPTLAQLATACWQGRGHLAQFLGNFSRFDIIRRVASTLETTGMGADAVLDGVKKAFEYGWFVNAGELRGQTRWTTAPVLEEEQKLLRRAARLEAEKGAQVPEADVAAFLARSPGLSSEQELALQVLAAGTSALQLLRGVAGSGKTLLLRALSELWDERGFQAVLCAPTHKAVREMEAATGGTGATVASIVRGRGVELSPQSILVVDESSMLSTPDALQLLKKAAVTSAKVILLGDQNQLQPAERGGAFLALWERYGGAELKESHRQRGWLQGVVGSIVQGGMDAALRMLQRQERLFEFVDEIQATRTAAGIWMRERTVDLADTLVVAGTRRQVEDLNDTIRRMRVDAGEIDPMKSVSDGKRRFAVGDRVVLTSTARDKSYFNGEFGTVERVAVDALFVRRDRLGRSAGERDATRVPLVDEWGRAAVQLGYAVTTFRSQGATVEKLIALATIEQDRAATYVQLSRARSDAWLVLSHQRGEGMDDFARALARQSRKSFAVELQQQRDARAREAPAVQPDTGL
jgi:conjugative relaxase-like TrwC/TraI family protein